MTGVRVRATPRIVEAGSSCATTASNWARRLSANSNPDVGPLDEA